jgi:hypothetical protein
MFHFLGRLQYIISLSFVFFSIVFFFFIGYHGSSSPFSRPT